MSASADLQAAIVALLQAPGALRVNCPVRDRVTGDYDNDIDASADKKGGLVVFVMPVLPMSAASMQGADFVFFDRAEVRVRIVESPRANNYEADAYDLLDDIAKALHWKGIPGDGSALGAILAHPLQLAERPCEIIEGVLEDSDQVIRVLDVIFHATFGFAES